MIRLFPKTLPLSLRSSNLGLYSLVLTLTSFGLLSDNSSAQDKEALPIDRYFDRRYDSEPRSEDTHYRSGKEPRE
jgi:hypothetical protein